MTPNIYVKYLWVYFLGKVSKQTVTWIHIYLHKTLMLINTTNNRDMSTDFYSIVRTVMNFWIEIKTNLFIETGIFFINLIFFSDGSEENGKSSYSLKLFFLKKIIATQFFDQQQTNLFLIIAVFLMYTIYFTWNQCNWFHEKLYTDNLILIFLLYSLWFSQHSLLLSLLDNLYILLF